MGAEQRRKIIGQRLMWHHGGFLRGLFRGGMDIFIGIGNNRTGIRIHLMVFGFGIGVAIDHTPLAKISFEALFNSPLSDCMLSAYVPNYGKPIA